MNKNTWTWIAVIAIFLFGAFAFWGVQKIFTPAPPQIKHDTIRTPFDTTAFQKKFREMLQLKPVIKYKDTGSIKWKDNIILIPYYKATRADTVRDYAAYHNTEWGKDTLTNDDNLFYEATHGITQNRLISFGGRYFIKQPKTVIQNNPMQPLKNQLYLGVKLDGLSMGFGIGGDIMLKTKSDAIWTAGVSYIPVLTKSPIYSIGRNFKIKF